MTKDSGKKGRPNKYKKITLEQRKKIFMLKPNLKKQEISRLFDLSEKTIESIKSPEIQNEYKEFKQDLIEKGFQFFMNQIELEDLTEKKKKKIVKSYLNCLVKQDQEYYDSITPKNRKKSVKRRIFDYMSLTIIDQLNKYWKEQIIMEEIIVESKSENSFISPEPTKEEVNYIEDFSDFCANSWFAQHSELPSQQFPYNIQKYEQYY